MPKRCLASWCPQRALVLLLLLGLAGCGGLAAGTPSQASSAAAQPLLVLTDNAFDQVGNEVYQVEAYQQGQRRWAVPLPAPGEALASAGGVIYVSALDQLYALDAQTGHQRWQAEAGPLVRTISIIEGLLYVDTGGGFSGQESIDVFSLEGRLLWQDVPPAFQDIPAWLVDGGVFYTVESSGNAALVARDAATGTRLFSAPLQVDTPLQALLPAGQTFVLVVTLERLVLVQRTDGAQVWQDQTQAVGVQVGAGMVVAFCVDQPATLGGTPPAFLRALQVSDGTLRWQQPLASSDAGFLSSGQPLAIGTITPQAAYLVDSPSFTTVHTWNLADGQPRWTRQATERLEGVMADAQTVSLASAAHLLALQADSGQVHWQQANPDDLTTLREEAGEFLGANPLTSVLAGYDLTSGRRVFRLQPQVLNQYLLIASP